jgi:hypothetical protein
VDHLVQITRGGEAETDRRIRRVASEIPLEAIPSAVLRRLVEEVRVEQTQDTNRKYDRWHNRHNRSR